MSFTLYHQPGLKKNPSSSSVRSNLVGTPVTENDPLGALSSPTSTEADEARSAASEDAMKTPTRRVDDNILGR